MAGWASHLLELNGSALELRCECGSASWASEEQLGLGFDQFCGENMRKTSELRCEKKTFWGNIFYFGNTHRKAGTLAAGAVGVLQLPSDLSKVPTLNPQSSPRVCLELLAPV